MCVLAHSNKGETTLFIGEKTSQKTSQGGLVFEAHGMENKDGKNGKKIGQGMAAFSLAHGMCMA